MTSNDRAGSGRGPIAPPPARHRQAAAFQAYVWIASIVFVVLAVMAHEVAYFPIDLTITRALQSHQHPALVALMQALSWIGFLPQVVWIGVVAVAIQYAIGLRWEAVVSVFAGLGPVFAMLVKLIVYRPRPSADLVHVLNQLASPSFPSGHVVTFVTYCGFQLFLTFTLFKPSPLRTVWMILLILVIVLMGPSRIYLGQHWFSDVMGAYVLGSLWLALTIRLYRWGKPRFFTRQPVAPVGR